MINFIIYQRVNEENEIISNNKRTHQGQLYFSNCENEHNYSFSSVHKRFN